MNILLPEKIQCCWWFLAFMAMKPRLPPLVCIPIVSQSAVQLGTRHGGEAARSSW